MRTEYFKDRNYALLYIHNILREISNAIIYTLTGAYFLDIGVSLPLIILFFGLEFGLRGLLCPIGIYVLKKFKVTTSIFIANIFQIIFFIILSFIGKDHMLIFIALIFYSISAAIYFPLSSVKEAIYIKDDCNRGKQLSLSLVLNSLASAFAVIIGSLLIVKVGYIGVAIFVAIILSLSTIPFIFLKGEPLNLDKYKVADGYKILTDKKFKGLTGILIGEQLVIVMGSVFVPLFIFFVVKDMQSYSYIVALSLGLNAIVTIFIGRTSDKKGCSDALKKSFCLSAITSTVLFTVTSPLTALAGDLLNKISYNAYSTALRTGTHLLFRKRSKNDLLLLGCGRQVFLCFAECITLSAMAFACIFIGHYIFYISFILGALGSFISWKSFKKIEKTEKLRQ